MKYYTDCIPLPLAEKLKEKGMPVEIVCDNTEEHSYPPEYHCETIFAEVFDWLLDKDIRIHLLYVPKSDLQDEVWRGIVGLDIFEGTWHEAAEKAIEKALELI